MAQFNLPSNYDVKSHSKTLASFKGVDYSHSKLEVSENRSTDMRNLLYKDGMLHKRNGYEQVLQLPSKINGMWQIKDVEYDNFITIVHSGNKLYKIYFNDDITSSYKSELHINTDSNYSYGTEGFDFGEIKDMKSYGVIKNDKLYIFCGTLLVYGKFDGSWQLRYVRDDENTYIPITRTNAKADGSFALLDEVNLLSSKRKVKLIGEAYYPIKIDEEFNNDNTYDGMTQFKDTYNKGIYAVLQYKPIKVLVSFFDEGNEIWVKMEHTLTGVNSSFTNANLNDFSDSGFVPEPFADIEFYYKEEYTSNGVILKIVYGFKNHKQETNTTISKNSFYNLDSGTVSEKIPVKIVNTDTGEEITENWQIEKNKLVFSDIDLTPSILGSPNIEVTFTTEEYINNKKWKWIENCSFGEILTYNDIETLFISGNPDMPNYDFHNSITFSEQQGDLTLKENLTYFGELSYAKIGNATNKITGYSLLEDGVLGIHKEYSNTESNFYVRNAEVSNATDLNGLPIYLQDNQTIAKTVIFPLISSSIGEGCVSPYSTKNLVGDKLMVSNNGIFGIELTSNIKTNERYAKQRSLMIDSVLTKENLKDSNAIVYDGKYFLYVGGEENKVYVADSRYRNYTDLDLRDTFSYEWFVLNNIEARVWFVDNGNNLYFGDSKGGIFKFVEDSFKDIKYNSVPVGIGQTQTNNFYNYIEFETGLINTNDKLYFNNQNFDEVLLTFKDIIVDKTKRDLIVDENIFNNVLRYYNGEKVKYYYDSRGGIKTSYCYLTINNDIKNCIFLTDLNGKYITSIIKLTIQIKSAEAVIVDNKCYLKGNQYKEFDTLETNPYLYKIIDSNASVLTSGFSCYVKNVKPVKSYFVTPVLHLGALGYLKTINNILITSLSNNSSIKFGYNTVSNGANLNTFEKEVEVKNVDYYNAWNNFDFYNTSFNMYEEFNTYNFKKKIKNFNTIQFYFLSEESKDAVISNFIIEYIITKKKK